ncbi:MAG: energy-coupling factor transporter ATPase [Clostridia bacterium]|nr:energy-coupling factor transporter ATPase [Clostridia bacterium]
MSSIIEVKNLCFSYDGAAKPVRDAIHDVSFSVGYGEIIGIIGHTGSGKSTLIQHLNGLLKPASGEVLLEGKNIWDEPKKIKDVRFKVGLVFQYPEYQLFEETVFEDIAFGPKNMGLKGVELDNRVRNICETVGIKEEYFEKSPFDLSGGEKRRVAIAGVMAMQPKVLILDEPIAGLDPRGRREIISMIKSYREKFGAAVIIVSHNMEDMAVLADKLLVMNGGRLEMFDTVYNVFSKGAHLFNIGLSVPAVTKILYLLNEKDRSIRTDIFTLGEAVEYLRSCGAGGGHA